MTENRFASVWDAIENTPQEVASMKARSGLMMALTAVIQERGMTQAEAAELSQAGQEAHRTAPSSDRGRQSFRPS